MAVEAEVVTDDNEGGGDSGKEISGGAGLIPRDYGFFACYDSVYLGYDGALLFLLQQPST